MNIGWIIVSSVGLSLGVGLSTIMTLPLAVAFFVTLLAVAVLVWRLRTRTSYNQLLRGVALLLIMMSIGMARVDYAASQFGQSPLSTLVGTDVSVEGIVVREPEQRSRTMHLYVEINETLVLVTTDRYTSVHYGDIVTIDGTLSLPKAFTTDFGRTFDYLGYLKAKGVEYTVSFATVDVVGSAAPSQFMASLFTLKHEFIQRLEAVIAEPYAALANGLLLGMKEGLGESLERDFQKAGLTHIVVLSGYNVMLIVSFVTFLLAFVLPPRVRLVVGLVAIVSFALTVGLSATVVRASIMAALFLIAQTLGRSYDVLRALLIAGMVMVLINPYLLIYDVGFQLSFMATLGLILALPYFKAPGQPETIGLSIKGYFVSTIATQIAVLPLLMYHIGEVSIVSVLVNVLVLPMVPVAMFVSFIATLATFVFSPLAILVGATAQLTLGYIILVATVFANLPFATISLPSFSPFLVLVGYAVLGLLYYRLIHPPIVQPLRGWTIIEEK